MIKGLGKVRETVLDKDETGSQCLHGTKQAPKVPRYSRCKDSQGQVYSNDVITGTHEVLNVLFVGETNDAPVRSRKAWSNRVQTTGSEIKSMYSFC